jgi:hypothetical protein
MESVHKPKQMDPTPKKNHVSDTFPLVVASNNNFFPSLNHYFTASFPSAIPSSCGS